MNRRLTSGYARQRGVALLTAVLLVALGTVLATAIAYQSAMVARRGTATFAFEQSIAFAQGAEALAAYALSEDRKNNQQQDHAAEDWAKPFGPVEVVPGVALEAVLEDLQGRFNLNSLVVVNNNGQAEANPHTVAAFAHLLQMLDLEEKWAPLIADWIDTDISPQPNGGGGEDNLYLTQVPPYRPPNRLIYSTSELLALPGFGRERYLRLKPYITALPLDAKINVCTASPYVLDALTAKDGDPGRTEYTNAPDNLIKDREGGCRPVLNDFKPLLPQENQDLIVQNSSYFRLTSVVTVGDTQFALYSVMFRQADGTARPILRTYTPE